MKAILRTVRISPKKANLIAALVRRKNALQATEILKFTQKKAAPILKKLIESAMANAEHNSKQEKEQLLIKEIIVTEGPTYKRRVPISRGRAHPILKRTSHITVKLAQQSRSETKAPKSKEAKATTKPEAKSESEDVQKEPTQEPTPKTTKK